MEGDTVIVLKQRDTQQGHTADTSDIWGSILLFCSLQYTFFVHFFCPFSVLGIILHNSFLFCFYLFGVLCFAYIWNGLLFLFSLEIFYYDFIKNMFYDFCIKYRV